MQFSFHFATRNLDFNSVTLEGSASVKASAGDEVNSWLVKLPATTGGDKQYSIRVSDTNGNSATLKDVLFGDVWVCSGQSNMAFLLENAFNGSNLVADADNYPLLRMFTSKKISSPHQPLAEQPQIEEPWVRLAVSLVSTIIAHCHDFVGQFCHPDLASTLR